MGAVYALFAGLYYWIGKLTGFTYLESLGHIHFWIFTLAINILFFPMHFLGLAGMPRRIPDYPTGYSYWNNFMSLGSILTFLSILILLFILSSLFNSPSPKSSLPCFPSNSIINK
jgi:cytochrome c oxidase subunit 1